MRHYIWTYIAVMAVVCYAIRVLPLTLLRRRIQSRFLRSFLYYVPYVTLSVMTFPSIIEATRSPIAGAAALILGVLLAWMGAGLFPVAASCCAVVFALEWLLVAA